MESNEKYIVENIRNHREEIDLDGLWADVSPQIPKKKQRRRFGFWIFGGLAVLTLLGISLAMYFPSEMVKSKMSTEGSMQESQSIVATNIDRITNENNSVKESKFIESDRKNNSSNALSNEGKLRENTSRSILQKQAIQANDNFVRSSNTLKNKKTNNIPPFYSKDESNGQDNSKSSFAVALNEEENDLKNIDSDEDTQSVDEYIKQVILAETATLTRKELKPLSFDRITPEMDLEVSIIDNRLLQVNQWSAYVLSGGGIASRKLSTKEIELIPEIERRDAVVDVMGSWELEAGIGFRLSPKLKIMTGLSYTQIHEKASFASEYLIESETQSVNSIYWQDGTVENKTSSTTSQGTRRTTEIRYNQLSLLQIPLKASYEFLTIKRFKLNIGAFAAYTINQKYAGVTSFSASSSSYDLNLDQENKFRTSSSISYGLFLEGTTHLSRMLDLSFGLGCRQTNKINTEIYLIDQQYNSLSFTGGISRRF